MKIKKITLMTGVLFLSLFVMLKNGICFAASSEEVNVYFNAGTENYLKGDFKTAVENLEKAISLDPGNQKIKEFLVKILLDAATQDHINHTYSRAMGYLEKAKALDPSNKKVMEMYQLTKEVLSSSNNNGSEKEGKVTEKKRQIPEPEVLPAKRAETQARKAEPVQPKVIYKEVEVRVQPVPVVQVSENKPVDDTARETNSRILYFLFFVSLLWAVAGTVLFVIYLVYYHQEKIKLEQTRKMLNELEENNQKASDEKDEIYKGLEKSRELLDYEHKTVEQLRNEISEVRKKENEKMRVELDQRTKQIEQRLRLEMNAKLRNQTNYKEEALQQEQEQFSIDIGSSVNVNNEEVSSPAIDALRERISIMALNLYENSPQSAVDFLVKFANDNNPLIRMNVISSLIKISSDETIGILLQLYQDQDNRVKREALKNLSKIGKRIKSGEIKLKKELNDRINQIIINEKSQGDWIF